MTPTNELRWLERTHRQEYEDYWNIRLDAVGNQVTERVWTTSTLQQKWIDPQGKYLPEWRDIELVKEPKQ